MKIREYIVLVEPLGEDTPYEAWFNGVSQALDFADTVRLQGAEAWVVPAYGLDD